MKHLPSVLRLVVVTAALAGALSACSSDGPADPGPTGPATVAVDSAGSGAAGVVDTPTIDPAAPADTTGDNPGDDATADDTTAGDTAADAELVGTQYGYLTEVDAGAGTITYDKVEFFTGDAAYDACIADGVAVRDQESCHDFYIRNHNDKLRTAPVDPGAKLSMVSPDDAMVQLEMSIEDLQAEHGEGLFRITFEGGSATRIRQEFLP